MVLFFLSVFAFAIGLGIAFLFFWKLLGKEDAIKQFRWILPIMPLIFAQTLLMNHFEESLSLISWLYSFVFGALALSWPMRNKNAGGLLLKAGGFPGAKYVFWVGVLLGAIALALTGNFVWNNGLSPDFFFREDIASLVMFAVLSIGYGKNQLELRENGICHVYRFFPWHRMTAYEWGARRRNMMTIEYRHRIIVFFKIIGVQVPKRYRDDVDRIVSMHILTTPIPSRELV